MIFLFSPQLRRTALVLLVPLVFAENASAKTRQSSRQTAAAEDSGQSLAANILAAQVREIADSKMISRAKKEKRISTTVRVAVVAATAYNSNPRQTLNLALELTAAAAAAAPSYAEVITNAVSFAPAMGRIDGAAGQIRTAAFSAAKSPQTRHRAGATASQPIATSSEEVDAEPMSAPRPNAVDAGQTEDESPAPVQRHRQPSESDDGYLPPSRGNKFSADKNSNFVVTAEAAARHDDNLFLSNTDKVGDTIYSVTPGVELQYGQNSLSHGSLNLKESFTRYANKTAPNANLGSGAADFGYANGDVTVSATADYQQIYQNDRDTAAVGSQTIFRQNLLGLKANVEGHFTPKTSLSGGAIFNKTTYDSTSLVNNQDVTVPLKLYYSITPKVSLSSGLEYRHSDTDRPNSAGKELYYNLGARGDFTPKFSGEFSVGYRTRTNDSTPKQNLLSFNGNFNYELTPKTYATLNFSRDFSTNALGDTLKNSSVGLKLSTNPTPQWQFETGLTYQGVDYGLVNYILNSTPPVALSTNRNDDYWIWDFQATYLFSNSLSLALDYSYRKNSSTIPILPGATFADNLLSLTLLWKY